MSNWGIRRASYGLLASDVRGNTTRRNTRSARSSAPEQPRVPGSVSSFAPVLTTVAIAGLLATASAVPASAGLAATTTTMTTTSSTTYIQETDPAIAYSGA